MRSALLASALAFFVAPLFADEVELNSGEVIRDCKAVEEGDFVRVIKGPGSRLIPRGEIKRIVKSETLDDQYLAKLKELRPDDVEGLLKLAAWCESRELKARAEETYRRVLDVDPDHEGARGALGYRRHLGKWLTEDEIREAQGFVKHKGRWMTPEERDLDVAMDRMKELEKQYVAEVRRQLDELGSSREEKRDAARARLAELEDRYKIQPLAAALKSSKANVRLYAAQELTRLKDLLKDTGGSVETAAVRGLCRMAIWDDDDAVRAASEAALAARQHPETAGFLRPFLGEESSAARIRTMGLLARFPEIRSVWVIADRLDSTVDTLRLIEKYEREAEAIIKGAILLKNGQKIPIPANIKFAGNLFDPESKRRIGEERDAALAALRRISGQDLGLDAAAWKAWYEKNKGTK